MRRILQRFYWAAKKRIAPGVISSQFAYRDTLLTQLKQAPRWLDLGCGHQFIPGWAWTPDADLLSALPQIVGVDGDLGSIRQHQHLKHRALGDIHSLPFAAGSFDLVTANMVMEHAQDPGRVLSEVHRVLSPDGVFLFHTPNLSSPLVKVAARTPEWVKKPLIRLLEARGEEDVYPTTYRINTAERVRRLGADAGFQVESCELVTSEAVTQALGPLVLFELLFIRLTQWKAFSRFRPDIIACLRTPAGAAAASKRAQ
jgi:SAM-dependent methyltransferase